METATEQRALLSDDAIDNHPQPIASANETISARWGMRQARDWYEARIASGELAVVKTAKAFQAPSFTGTFEGIGCHGCGRSYPKASEPFNDCPGCGAKIVE